MAIKHILENTETFGFHYREQDMYKYIDYDTISIDTTIDDLVSFAKDNKTNYKILKRINPWMRSRKVPNASGKKYIIRIPKSKGRLIRE
jgi:hypothetical protein